MAERAEEAPKKIVHKSWASNFGNFIDLWPELVVQLGSLWI